MILIYSIHHENVTELLRIIVVKYAFYVYIELHF